MFKMHSYRRHPQQQQQLSSFIDPSSGQQQSQQQQISVTMAPIPMTTSTLDFCLDGSLDQAFLDIMNANTSDLLTMEGFEGSFSFTPEYPSDNTALDNQNNWASQKEQDWMLTPYNFQQHPSSLFSESSLPLHSSQHQHHFQQQPQQYNHHHYYQHFQQQQQQHHDHDHDQQQTQQQQEEQQFSHIHPLQTLSPLACDALLTNTDTSSNNGSGLFFEEPTSIAPYEMLPIDASLASSPSWSSSPASVASSIEDNKPATPLDTTFDDELTESRQLELVHRSSSPLPTTIFDDDREDEEDYDQDNQSLFLVQQQQQEQEEVELEEDEQEDDEDDNDSDPDWSIGKKPQQQHSRRHVRKNSKTPRATNKSNKKICAKKLANHNSRKSSSGPSTPDLTNNSDIRCTNCETQNTPLWRRDSAGEPLCNACGLFLKLHGIVRPLSLKTDVIKKRNRSGHSIHKSSRGRKSRREKK